MGLPRAVTRLLCFALSRRMGGLVSKFDHRMFFWERNYHCKESTFLHLDPTEKLNCFLMTGFHENFFQFSEFLSRKSHDDFGKNGLIDAKDIDELFNFDAPSKSAPLGSSVSSVDDERFNEHHRNSMVVPDTQPKVHPIVPPRTPQFERRKRQGGSNYGDSYRRSLGNHATSSRDIASKRNSSDSGLFHSIVNIWKRSEGDKLCANVTDGLLESDFLLENLIRLYFKCRNKLNNQSLRGTECMDIRQELYQKIKSFRVALEASNQDMDDLSSSFNICVILTTKLFQKTFSKNEIQLIKAIAQYFSKKWFGSAFRLRNFGERKDDLLKKVMKFLDREL